MGYEVVIEALKQRLKRGGYPPFWTPKEKGETLVGQVTAIRNSVWDQNVKTYEVKTFDGETYSTPNNAVLNRLLEESKIKIGDYLMIRFEGTMTTGRGRKAKDFSVAVLHKEEAEKILRAKREGIKPLISESKEESAKIESPETEKKIELSRVPDEVKEFIDELFSFYTDGIPEEQFKKYLERRNISVPMIDLMRECSLMVVNGVVKRK